jgi:hypothetical protein
MRICFGEIEPSGAMDSVSAYKEVPYHLTSIKLRQSSCRADVAPRLKLCARLPFFRFQ